MPSLRQPMQTTPWLLDKSFCIVAELGREMDRNKATVTVQVFILMFSGRADEKESEVYMYETVSRQRFGGGQ